MSECELVVSRWRRYGKDRLYVTRPDEAKVGWWDLTTGEAHPEVPELLVPLVDAVEEWRRAEHRDDVRPATVAPEPAAAGAEDRAGSPEPIALLEPTAPPVAVRPWTDLTSNVAGAEARGQALAAREAAPVRTFFARAMGVHTDERAWRIGADGEEAVATRLVKVTKKDPRWRILHAVPVGPRGSDIDHVVIGPGGVFTINTKHHPKADIWVGGDTVLVNGHRQPYVRNSRHEATRAGRLLSAACGFPVHVEGVIVLVNAGDLKLKTAPEEVRIVRRRQVARWLLGRGDVLTGDEVEAIHRAARRSTTWT